MLCALKACLSVLSLSKCWEGDEHLQARTGCGCKQQLLKHNISLGTYLLWGKFESLGRGAALRQEMPLRGGARSERGQMWQLCLTVCPWQQKRGAWFFWCVTALGQQCWNDVGFGLGYSWQGGNSVNIGRMPKHAARVPIGLNTSHKIGSFVSHQPLAPSCTGFY